jgi:transcriptional regulator with XRE-family HTH domain
MTQEELAERAGLSAAMVQKLEQGRRNSARTSTLIALAEALDVDLSELLGKRPWLERDGDDVRVLALCDALLSPDLVFDEADGGSRAVADGPELERRVAAAWAEYWAGRFGRLVAVFPQLLSDACGARRERGSAAAAVLTQAYWLAGCVLAHLGRDDLAVLGAERAVLTATEGDDELRWASAQGPSPGCCSTRAAPPRQRTTPSGWRSGSSRR